MYFKTNDKSVLDEYFKFIAAREKLHDAAVKFADEFNAVPVVLQDIDWIYFRGIVFKSSKAVNDKVWTKPDVRYGYQQLRRKPMKAAFKEEWKADNEKYNSLFEKYFPDKGNIVLKESLYNSFGIAGELFFNRISYFELDGYMYFDTTIKMKFEEILGSEFEVARKTLAARTPK